jgi:hypothetical protein
MNEMVQGPSAHLQLYISEGHEKYLREISITPVGYFTGAITPVGYFTGAIKNHLCAVSHRNYFAWRK